MSKQLNTIVEKFVVDFNKMCVETGRNKLVKHTTSTYEGTVSTSTSNYEVTYKVKPNDKKWKIIGESKGWWIFKSKFPLLTIEIKKGELNFSGLYATKLPDCKVNDEELEASLLKYFNDCKSIPVSTFTNV